MELCDAHSHLDSYSPQDLSDLLNRARAASVTLILSAGTTLESSRLCVELAQRESIVYAGVGIHPQDVKAPVDEAVYAELKALARQPKVAAISEIGLDFQPQSPECALQEQAFRAQIRLARELKLPIIFHSREAYADTLRILREEKADEVGGAMHYFQGDLAVAREAIDLNFYISLAKPLLRLPELQETVKQIPMDKIVLETDSFPQPWKKHRKNWTEPAHVLQVAEKAAQIYGCPLEEIAAITTRNLRRLLRL